MYPATNVTSLWWVQSQYVTVPKKQTESWSDQKWKKLHLLKQLQKWYATTNDAGKDALVTQQQRRDANR